MQGLQRDLPTFVVIIAVVAFLAGLCCERIRAGMARRAWQNRRWGRGGVAPLKTWGREGGVFPSRREQLLSRTQQSSFA